MAHALGLPTEQPRGNVALQVREPVYAAQHFAPSILAQKEQYYSPYEGPGQASRPGPHGRPAMQQTRRPLAPVQQMPAPWQPQTSPAPTKPVSPRVSGVIAHVSPDPTVMPKIVPPPEPLPGTYTPLLPPKQRAMKSRPTLVLDLDETLIHSSFLPMPADHVVPISVDGQCQMVYVKLRPHLHEFLDCVSKIYEVVVLTASMEQYASPVIDTVDRPGYKIHHRLFRDSCANLNGTLIKDLSYLGRPLHTVIIIDNCPISYVFQPKNALPIASWFDDPADRALLELLPVLEKAAKAETVYAALEEFQARAPAPVPPPRPQHTA